MGNKNFEPKKSLFIIFLIFLTLISWLILDFIASNTILKKNEDCYNFEMFYYELKKNCIGKNRFKSSFPTVDVYTDKYGLRSFKDNKKLNEAKNIFIFGDSFTFGLGLNYEDTHTGLLEKDLKSYNFYNFAVGSYSPTVHLYKLKQAIQSQILPDKILIFLDLTDIFDEGSRWFINKKDGKPNMPNDDVFQSSNKKESFKKKNLKLSTEFAALTNKNIRILRSKIKNTFKKDNQVSFDVKTSFQGQFTYTKLNNLNKIFWTEEIFENGLYKIEKNINLISKIAKELKSEFYLIIYPWAETLEYGQSEFSWSKFGKQLCLNNKCKLIDTIPDFIEYKEYNKNWVNELYFVRDEHFNKGGAKLISDSVKKKIVGFE